MLATGTPIDMPTKFPAEASSVTRDATTKPGWVFLKKFRGRVRM